MRISRSRVARSLKKANASSSHPWSSSRSPSGPLRLNVERQEDEAVVGGQRLDADLLLHPDLLKAPKEAWSKQVGLIASAHQLVGDGASRAVKLGSAGGAGAARASPLAWFPPAADIEPCMRFPRTRLPDVLHRAAFSVPAATAGWVVARRWFR